MNKQAHNHQPNTGHAHPAAHPADGQHHFKGIEKWIERLDSPARAEKQLPDEVIAKLALQDDDVIADIGAGTGYFALRIAAAYPQIKVMAADPEVEMIDYLKSQAAARKLSNLAAVSIDPAAPKLPVRASLALIVDTLHHVSNRVEYLNILHQSMAPGARIAIIDYRPEATEGPHPGHRLPSSTVADELKQVGYTLAQEFAFLPNQYFLIFQQA